jgi:hypothetical protein
MRDTEDNMSKDAAVRLSVSWGYDVTVDLHISGRNWTKIVKGKKVTIRGKGYYYEGDFFGIIGIFPVKWMEGWRSDTGRRRQGATPRKVSSALCGKLWSNNVMRPIIGCD